MAAHPCKNEVVTADGTGRVKTWSFVEKTSPLNNNEAISNDMNYTWTCSYQHVYNEESIRSIHYSHDGSVMALSHGRSITLWNSSTHELLHVLPTPPPNNIVSHTHTFHNRFVHFPSSLQTLSFLLSLTILYMFGISLLIKSFGWQVWLFVALLRLLRCIQRNPSLLLLQRVVVYR